MSNKVIYIVSRGAQGPAGSGGGDTVAGSSSISVTGSGTKTIAAIFGALVNTICQGNDGRLSDARTPVAHAATLITSGILALARGGAGADLSATGGTNHVLQQSTVGGAVSTGQLAHSALSGSTSGDPHTQYAALSPALGRNLFHAANNGDFAKLVLAGTYADAMDVWGIYQGDDTPHLSLNWNGATLAMYLSGAMGVDGVLSAARVESNEISIAGNTKFLELTQNAGIKMRDLTGAHTVTVKVSPTMTTSFTVRHPTGVGTAGQARVISSISGGTDIQEEYATVSVGSDSGRKFVGTPADGSSGAALLRALIVADLPTLDFSDLSGGADPTNYSGAVRKVPTATGDNDVYSTSDVPRLTLRLMATQTAFQLRLKDSSNTDVAGIDNENFFRAIPDAASGGIMGYKFFGVSGEYGMGYDQGVGATVIAAGADAATFFLSSASGGGVGFSGLLDAPLGALFGANVEIQSGNLNITTLGRGISIKQGSSSTCGHNTLVGGTVTVSNTNVTSGCEIFCTVRSLGTVTDPKAVGVTGRSNGVSFTIKSADPTDTSVVSWWIIKTN